MADDKASGKKKNFCAITTFLSSVRLSERDRERETLDRLKHLFYIKLTSNCTFLLSNHFF